VVSCFEFLVHRQACLTTVFNLGQCHRKRRQWVLAARCFEAALSLDPDSGATHGALAFTHHLSGRLDYAVSNFRGVWVCAEV